MIPLLNTNNQNCMFISDLFEGVVSQDLLGVIRILSSKKWFSIEQYNFCLKNLSFGDYESSDRPQSVPTKLKDKKLAGKACSIWLHMRYFPLVVRMFVKDSDDMALTLGLRLHEIVERLTAGEFQEYEIVVLDELIINYLNERKVVAEMFHSLLGNPKPKTHYLSHYPQAVKLYGPPMAYWTARYESRHRLAKNTAESSKNFKNISLTIASRQQMRLSSVMYHGMFSSSKIFIMSKPMARNSLSDQTEAGRVLKTIMDSSDTLSTDVEYCGQVYRKRQLVITQLISPDEMKVGIIQMILVKKESVCFVLQEFTAYRQPLRYFKSTLKDSTLVVVDATKISDYKPLVNLGTSSQLVFCLHHNISFSYL